MISPKALQEFKKIYLEEFKEELSDERAMELAPAFLTLMSHIYRPVKKEWLDEIQNNN